MTVASGLLHEYGWTFYGLLRAGKRADAVAMRRQVIAEMYRHFSLPQIARALGYRDHSTVHHHLVAMGLARSTRRRGT